MEKTRYSFFADSIQRIFGRVSFYVVVFFFTATSVVAFPGSDKGPVAPSLLSKGIPALQPLVATAIDRQAARAEDPARERAGFAPRFALAESVAITPETDGTWEDLDADFKLWRLRIQAPGALSLNFGFSGYRLPADARLSVYPTDFKGIKDTRGVRVFDASDNEAHGELWTPVVISDDVTIELLLPTSSRDDYILKLSAINKGYRKFGEETTDKSGTCNVDVICPEGDEWRNEINSVGEISTGGTAFCSGSMLNNTAEDGTPYFLTANHCGITAGNAASLVVYWNFQSPVCGQQGGGLLNQFMTGSTHLASSAISDFTLVQLDDPVNPDHHITFAGWDRSNNDPGLAVAIHHPSNDEKSISIEYDPATTTSYYGTAVPGDGTHIRITDWDLGTTEGGSSGSPLFDQNHRVVGQLHGGDASCIAEESDWYGRLSVSFPSINQYLDPLNSGAMTINTLSLDTALKVTPVSGIDAQGNGGGPFTPPTTLYTLLNMSDITQDYTVTSNVNWLDIAGAAGTLAAGESADVLVSFNSNAEGFSNGRYSGVISFTTPTFSASRSVTLQVGQPAVIYSFNMDSDPNWDMQGQWAYGIPTGSGGVEHGNPDPDSGATGSSVIGYNLNGDYTNNLLETHLTSTAINCRTLTAVSLKFKRYLNVENSSFDHCSLRVSNDGVVFTTLWENSDEITDSTWLEQEFDLSRIADGAETLFVRWTMGATDESYSYSGWNIDDIEIWGLDSSIQAPRERNILFMVLPAIFSGEH